MQVQSLGGEDPLEKKMATHSSIVVWEIPYTEDPDGLQFMESQRVGRDLGTKQQGVLIHSNRVITYLSVIFPENSHMIKSRTRK